jgi:UDP-N-acetylmuramate dehydrogenase
VHHGGGTGQQLWDFAQQIIQSVFEKFGVRIEPEVRVV